MPREISTYLHWGGERTQIEKDQPVRTATELVSFEVTSEGKVIRAGTRVRAVAFEGELIRVDISRRVKGVGIPHVEDVRLLGIKGVKAPTNVELIVEEVKEVIRPNIDNT